MTPERIGRREWEMTGIMGMRGAAGNRLLVLSRRRGVFCSRGGDYHTLLSYQKAEVIYEITYRFCQRFLGKNDRTVDQMVQAARSGKQNIIEGNKAAVTSKETEIKLTNVARKLGTQSPLTYEAFREFAETRPAYVVANIAICLIHQASYLLDRQLAGLEKAFLQDGGLRERMARARLQARNQQRSNRDDNRSP